MKKILVIILLQMAITFNVFAQGEGDRIVNPTWKLSSGALTPTVSTWTLTLPATTFSPSIITPLIIGGADTVSTLTYKTTTGVGKTGARHIFQVGNNGATEAMTILNSGFVGIGTTSPGAKLDVYSTTNPEIRISNGGGTSPNPTLTLFRQAGVSANINYDVANKNLIIQNDYSTVDTLGNIYFNTRGANTKVTIKGDGNVGIQLTTPTSKLHLAAGTATTGTAPLGFTSGTLLTTAVAGKVEFLTDAYYGTITTGSTRKTFAFLESPTFTGGITIAGAITGNAVTRGADAFITTATSDTVTISGAAITDYYTITLTGTAAPLAADAIRLQKTTTGFVLWRSASGTSGLTYDWFRQK